MDWHQKRLDRLRSRTEFDLETGCLNWMGTLFAGGYGMFHWGYEDDGRRRILNAQRAAWILAYGEPGELMVLHKCHNRRCCNVNHLYLGDHRQNMRDMVQSGRANKGADRYNFKRGPELMENIKRDLIAGLSVARVCGKNAISWGTFYNALNADADLKRIVKETKSARYSAAQKARFG